jgi:hypothetical protein
MQDRSLLDSEEVRWVRQAVFWCGSIAILLRRMPPQGVAEEQEV